MASSSQGVSYAAPHYDATPLDKFYVKDHPQREKTRTLFMQYIKMKTPNDWMKTDVSPVVVGAVVGGVAGGVVGYHLPLPGGTIGGIAIGAGVGAGVGLLFGGGVAGYLNYKAFEEWKKGHLHGGLAEEVNTNYSNSVTSEYICTITQSTMMCPMKHKTIPNLRYDKEQLLNLFKNPDSNRTANDTRDENTRIDPNTRKIIRLEDFEFDPIALLDIKNQLSNTLKQIKSSINPHPETVEGMELYIKCVDQEMDAYYFNEIDSIQKLMHEKKIDRNEHRRRTEELNKIMDSFK